MGTVDIPKVKKLATSSASDKMYGANTVTNKPSNTHMRCYSCSGTHDSKSCLDFVKKRLTFAESY